MILVMMRVFQKIRQIKTIWTEISRKKKKVLVNPTSWPNSMPILPKLPKKTKQKPKRGIFDGFFCKDVYRTLEKLVKSMLEFFLNRFSWCLEHVSLVRALFTCM